MIEIELPDGSKLTFEGETSVKEIAGKIAKSLEKNAVGALFNGEIIDVHTPIEKSGTIRILTPKDPESLEILRHSAAHIMEKDDKNLYGKE